MELHAPVLLARLISLKLDNLRIIDIAFPRLAIIRQLQMLIFGCCIFVFLFYKFFVKLPVVLLVEGFVNLVDLFRGILVSLPLLLPFVRIFWHSQLLARVVA